MRVIHGDYYGGNKWKGSSVVEMVLGGSQKQGVVRKSSSANSPVNYAHNDQNRLDEHIQSKHPNLTNRIQAFKAALGLNDSDEPDTKRIKLDYKEVHKRETDELTNNNNLSNNNNNIKSVEEDNIEEKSKEEEANQIEDLSQPKPVVE